MPAAAKALPAAAAGPPPITLDDLDRDELLELARRAYVLQRPRDLWGVRWRVASERTKRAWKREIAARDEVHDAFSIVMARMGGATKLQRGRWEAARVAEDRAVKARERADRHEARAWAALEACP